MAQVQEISGSHSDENGNEIVGAVGKRKKVNDGSSAVVICAHCRKMGLGKTTAEAAQALGLQRCSRCQNVYYCGRKCQQEDWTRHKEYCKPPMVWSKGVSTGRESQLAYHQAVAIDGCLVVISVSLGNELRVDKFRPSTGGWTTLFSSSSSTQQKQDQPQSDQSNNSNNNTSDRRSVDYNVPYSQSDFVAAEFACCVIADRYLMLFGGVELSQQTEPMAFFDDTCLFDTKTRSWIRAPASISAPSPRAQCTCTAVGRKVYVIGGRNAHQYFDDVFVFDAVTLMWAGPIKTRGQKEGWCGLAGHTACLAGRKIVVFGGRMEGGQASPIRLFDVDMHSWNTLQTRGPKPKGRCHHGADIVGPYLVVCGGENVDRKASKSVELDLADPDEVGVLNLETGVWTQPMTTGWRPEARIECTATVVGDKLYMYGGYQLEDDGNVHSACGMRTLDLENFSGDRKKSDEDNGKNRAKKEDKSRHVPDCDDPKAIADIVGLGLGRPPFVSWPFSERSFDPNSAKNQSPDSLHPNSAPFSPQLQSFPEKQLELLKAALQRQRLMMLGANGLEDGKIPDHPQLNQKWQDLDLASLGLDGLNFPLNPAFQGDPGLVPNIGWEQLLGDDPYAAMFSPGNLDYPYSTSDPQMNRMAYNARSRVQADALREDQDDLGAPSLIPAMDSASSPLRPIPARQSQGNPAADPIRSPIAPPIPEQSPPTGSTSSRADTIAIAELDDESPISSSKTPSRHSPPEIPSLSYVNDRVSPEVLPPGASRAKRVQQYRRRQLEMSLNRARCSTNGQMTKEAVTADSDALTTTAEENDKRIEYWFGRAAVFFEQAYVRMPVSTRLSHLVSQPPVANDHNSRVSTIASVLSAVETVTNSLGASVADPSRETVQKLTETVSSIFPQLSWINKSDDGTQSEATTEEEEGEDNESGDEEDSLDSGADVQTYNPKMSAAYYGDPPSLASTRNVKPEAIRVLRDLGVAINTGRVLRVQQAATLVRLKNDLSESESQRRVLTDRLNAKEQELSEHHTTMVRWRNEVNQRTKDVKASHQKHLEAESRSKAEIQKRLEAERQTRDALQRKLDKAQKNYTKTMEKQQQEKAKFESMKSELENMKKDRDKERKAGNVLRDSLQKESKSHDKVVKELTKKLDVSASETSKLQAMIAENEKAVKASKASLMEQEHRVSSLEKERDEILKKKEDMVLEVAEMSAALQEAEDGSAAAKVQMAHLQSEVDAARESREEFEKVVESKAKAEMAKLVKQVEALALENSALKEKAELLGQTMSNNGTTSTATSTTPSLGPLTAPNGRGHSRSSSGNDDGKPPLPPNSIGMGSVMSQITAPHVLGQPAPAASHWDPSFGGLFNSSDQWSNQSDSGFHFNDAPGLSALGAGSVPHIELTRQGRPVPVTTAVMSTSGLADLNQFEAEGDGGIMPIGRPGRLQVSETSAHGFEKSVVCSDITPANLEAMEYGDLEELESIYDRALAVIKGVKRVRQKEYVARLESEFARVNRSHICVACGKQPCEVLFMPCHHMSICSACHEANAPLQVCPRCSRRIERMEIVYWM